MDVLLTPRDAAELLPHVTRQTLLRWARNGEVPHVRYPSGRIFFRRSDIEALLTPVVAGAWRPAPIGGASSAGVSLVEVV